MWHVKWWNWYAFTESRVDFLTILNLECLFFRYLLFERKRKGRNSRGQTESHQASLQSRKLLFCFLMGAGTVFKHLSNSVFALQSPADLTRKIHAGDEVIQVNQQTVVRTSTSQHHHPHIWTYVMLNRWHTMNYNYNYINCLCVFTSC